MNIICTKFSPSLKKSRELLNVKIFKQSVSNLSNTSDNNAKTYKIVGKTKHFPYATKEWKNSVYAFNKTYLKQSPFKHKLTDDLIKSYFTINNYKYIARSRRMRGLILRSSSKAIFLSKPEIKQTNDKVIVTIYSYNREKQAYIRNLYFYKRKQSFYNLWLNNQNPKTIRKSKLYGTKHSLVSRKSFSKLNKRIPYHNISFKNETDFLRFKFMNFYNKFFNFNNNFMFLFIKLFLSVFNIKLFKPLNQLNEKNKEINNKYIENIVKNKPKLLIIINTKLSKLELIKSSDINLKHLQSIVSSYKSIPLKQHPMLSKLNLMRFNYFLWYFVKNRFVNYNFIASTTYSLLFVTLKKSFFKSTIVKYLKRRMKILNHFTKLEMNNLKFNVLLTYLKNLISKIYGKKTEFNIVNLKYFQLNSDIYAKVVARKLTKKINALKILNYCFKSFTLPNRLLIRNKDSSNMNDFKNLNTVKSPNLTILNSNSLNHNSNDKLNNIFSKLFPNSAVHNGHIVQPYAKGKNDYSNNKVVDVLNTIKYKWVKGIKLTVAGRLTRRNTASRALKKFKTKGNLNDAQYYLELNELRDLSKVILRNNIKANIQYTSAKSKKRTGAFGIKSWISSY